MPGDTIPAKLLYGTLMVRFDVVGRGQIMGIGHVYPLFMCEYGPNRVALSANDDYS